MDGTDRATLGEFSGAGLALAAMLIAMLVTPGRVLRDVSGRVLLAAARWIGPRLVLALPDEDAFISEVPM